MYGLGYNKRTRLIQGLKPRSRYLLEDINNSVIFTPISRKNTAQRMCKCPRRFLTRTFFYFSYFYCGLWAAPLTTNSRMHILNI